MGRSDLEDIERRLKAYSGDPRWVQRQVARERAIRQRRIALASFASLAVIFAAAGAWTRIGGSSTTPGGGTTAATSAKKTTAPPTLPDGGRTILPRTRVVAFYGAPEDAGLGTLGIGTPDAAGRRLDKMAAKYRADRPVLPAMELIATVVQAAPGADGMYRARQSSALIGRYLAAARRAHALLILDIQPGRSPFMREVRSYARWLREPDVGLALDPEWSMAPGQVPGTVIGSTDAAIVNHVQAYLAQIVKAANLPQKLLIVHRFTTEMIRNPRTLHPYPGVALTINVDGFGDRDNKVSKYDLFSTRKPGRYNGFKLFFHEDTGLMTPRAVMKLIPRPDVVVYE
jgi:hypothetical protein